MEERLLYTQNVGISKLPPTTRNAMTNKLKEILKLLQERCGITYHSYTNIIGKYTVSLNKRHVPYNPMFIGPEFYPHSWTEKKEISGVCMELSDDTEESLWKILSDGMAMGMAFNLPAVTSVQQLRMFLDIAGR